MSFKIDLSAVKKELEKMPHKADAAIGAALWQGGNDIIRRATPKVPVDTGTLRRSYVVQRPKKSGDVISVTVGYGTHYALFVHERTDLNHAVGQSKFLTAAIKEESGQIGPKLAERIRKALNSGHPGVQPRQVSGATYSGGVK